VKDPDGIVAKNVANLHAEKRTDSEQVTQAIMGQPLWIEKEDGDWLYVRTWDTYHGWILKSWVTRDVKLPVRAVEVTSLFTDALRAPDLDGEIWTKLVITTALEFLDEQYGMAHVRLPDGNDAWVIRRDVEIMPAHQGELPLDPTGPELIQTGKRFLGVPYLWGGSTPFGLDCSGFVQLVYKLNGVGLLRDAHMQAEDVRAVPVEKPDMTAGDLVFFAGGEDKSKITHVGLACGDGTFVHSAGSGKGVGVNNLEDEPYDRNYWGARRMSER